MITALNLSLSGGKVACAWQRTRLAQFRHVKDGMMLKHIEITKRRLRQFASEAGLRGRIYPRRAPVGLKVYSAPDRIPFDEALRGEYRAAQVGEQFGPVWSTHWFRVDISIPDDWRGQ